MSFYNGLPKENYIKTLSGSKKNRAGAISV